MGVRKIRFEGISTGWDSAKMWKIDVISAGHVAPMQTSTSGTPQRTAMDMVSASPQTEKGSAYIVVIGDYVKKWVEAYPHAGHGSCISCCVLA